ncbi:DUF6044 family protein [Gottfriedia sp. OAE603]|uniref:DUF6044 family protein n=1 Tax=Gottfriedia sp. OAE603 TaxID=2663872 RepID=UPI0017891D08
MNFWKQWSVEKRHIFLAITLLILFVSPLFILGENAHIRIHDNLDSNIAWYKTLNNSGTLFGNINDVVPQVINGLPRNAYGTEFSGIQWLHAIFPSMLAYALSQTISRVFAFIGMYKLLVDHFIPSKDGYLIRIWVSLAFALTPFWPSGMLSTLGMPLALWAFLNIRSGKNTFKEWLTIILLPFYSSFVLGFFFFLVAVSFIWVRDLFIKKRINWTFLTSIVCMTFIYLAIEYRLVYSLLFPDEPTSRNEFFSSVLGFRRTMRLVFKNYIVGHTHVLALHTLVILPFSFIVLMMNRGEKKSRYAKKFMFLFVLNILLSVWYAFWFFKGWEPLKEQFQLLNTFNFARFHFLRPMVIYLMFAIGCYLLWQKGKIGQYFVKLCLFVQLIVVITSNEEIVYRAYGSPNFKQFYAEKQFKKIEEYIGKPKADYRVASIGLHPAISQYNGFYTIDTYNNFYPLKYKHQFRNIIATELDKSPKLERYFDQWGGRCYIFVAELGKKYDYEKDSNIEVKNLQLNTRVFKNMGGKYIFSAVPIKNASQNGMKLMKTFDDQQSAWKIYLYEVI